MAQASADTTPPDAQAQFEVNGYVISDDNHWAFRDLHLAMMFTAELIEQQDEMDDDQKGAIDVTTNEIAAVIRTFARLSNMLSIDAPYTWRAPVRKQRGDSQ